MFMESSAKVLSNLMNAVGFHDDNAFIMPAFYSSMATRQLSTTYRPLMVL